MAQSMNFNSKVLKERARTVVVKNLACEQDAQSIFSTFGQFKFVSKFGGSDGWLYVIFRDERSVQKAIDKFHGSLINEKQISVERLNSSILELSISSSTQITVSHQAETNNQPVVKPSSNQQRQSKSPSRRRSVSPGVKSVSFTDPNSPVANIAPEQRTKSVSPSRSSSNPRRGRGRSPEKTSQQLPNNNISTDLAWVKSKAMETVILLGGLKNLIPDSNKAAHNLIDAALANNAAMGTRGDGLPTQLFTVKANTTSDGAMELSNSTVARRNRKRREFATKQPDPQAPLENKPTPALSRSQTPTSRAQTPTKTSRPPLQQGSSVSKPATHQQVALISTIASVAPVEGRDDMDVVCLNDSNHSILVSVVVNKGVFYLGDKCVYIPVDSLVDTNQTHFSHLRLCGDGGFKTSSSALSVTSDGGASDVTDEDGNITPIKFADDVNSGGVQGNAQLESQWFHIKPQQITSTITSQGIALPLSAFSVSLATTIQALFKDEITTDMIDNLIGVRKYTPPPPAAVSNNDHEVSAVVNNLVSVVASKSSGALSKRETAPKNSNKTVKKFDFSHPAVDSQNKQPSGQQKGFGQVFVGGFPLKSGVTDPSGGGDIVKM